MARDPLLAYLEDRLGRGQGYGVERHFGCPFCLDRLGSESAKAKLDINLEHKIAACYRCEWKGTLLRLFRDINPHGRVTLEELRLLRNEKMLEPHLGPLAAVRGILKGPVKTPPDAFRKHVPLPAEYISIAGNPGSPRVAPAVRYLKARGSTPDQWERFQIGYAVDGRYAGYLIFPVIQGGDVAYFTTRYALGQGRMKSLNPRADEAGLDKTKDDVLLNYDNCVGAPMVALAEGPFSCMAFDHAVAGFGKAYTDRQVELVCSLAHYGTREFVVAFDDDAVGLAQAMVRRLTGRVPKVTLAVFEKGDPWDNRADLPQILAKRSANAGFMALVKSRLRV